MISDIVKVHSQLQQSPTFWIEESTTELPDCIRFKRTMSEFCQDLSFFNSPD